MSKVNGMHAEVVVVDEAKSIPIVEPEKPSSLEPLVVREYKAPETRAERRSKMRKSRKQ